MKIIHLRFLFYFNSTKTMFNYLNTQSLKLKGSFFIDAFFKLNTFSMPE